VIEHRRDFDSGLIAIVQTRPEDATQNSEDCKCERTDGEHRKDEMKVSTVHAPSNRCRQPESAPSSVILTKTIGRRTDGERRVRALPFRMPPTFRNGLYAGLLLAVIVGIFLARLWQPERQVQLHSAHLLTQIEKKNWNGVAAFIGEGYQDRWGHDRAVLLERLRLVFRFAGNPQIAVKNVGVRVESGKGLWTARITIKAAGEFAPVIEERVSSLPAPFELEWRRGSNKPWDWKLVRVDNAALEISHDSL
jgi:hypothetical protein